MTVVLAYVDKDNHCTHMAGDACASDAINKSIVKNEKVFHPVGRKDILFGCAGTFRLPNLLKYVPGIFPAEDELATDDIDMSYLINEFTPVVRALTEDFDDDDAWELLIAVGDRLYRMQMDLSILEPADTCDAIGIGGQVALGAFKVLNELETNMTINDRINHALNVACSSCQGCQPPFSICKTEPLDDETITKAKEFNKDREKRGYEIIRDADGLEFEDEEEIVEETKPKKKKDKKKPKKK